MLLGTMMASTPAIAAQPLRELPKWQSEFGRQHPLTGKIWSAAKNSFVTARDVAAALGGADYILLGEKHDNADHHLLQAWLLKAAIDQGRRPGVAFEMIRADQRDALNSYLRDHPRDAAGLGKAVTWEERGWPEWAIYRPIAEAALSAGLPIAAADLSENDRKSVGREGLEFFDQNTRQSLALDRPLAPALRQALIEELDESHCGMLPEAAIGPMINVQRARDAAMAETLIKAREKGSDGAVLIAGAGHVQADRAVPLYLRQRQPAAKTVVVAFREVSDDSTDLADYLDPIGSTPPNFDFIWFTPRLDNDDPCVKYADQLKPKKKTNNKSTTE